MTSCDESGFTMAELLIVVAIIVILMIVAVPRLRRAQVTGNEASAIGSLRAIHGAQNAFLNACGSGYYSPSLTNLGRGIGGASPGFISEDLSVADQVTKRGYLVTIVPGVPEPTAPPSCNGLGAGTLVPTYSSLASPFEPGVSGTRWFVTNQGGSIFQNTSAMPAWQGGPPPAGATPIH